MIPSCFGKSYRNHSNHLRILAGQMTAHIVEVCGAAGAAALRDLVHNINAAFLVIVVVAEQV